MPPRGLKMERRIPGGAPTQRAKWLKELPSFDKPPHSAAFVFGQTWPSDLGHVRLHSIEGLHSQFESRDALFRSSLARNRRFSASISTDAAGVALPESLCLRAQTRRVSLL